MGGKNTSLGIGYTEEGSIITSLSDLGDWKNIKELGPTTDSLHIQLQSNEIHDETKRCINSILYFAEQYDIQSQYTSHLIKGIIANFQESNNGELQGLARYMQDMYQMHYEYEKLRKRCLRTEDNFTIDCLTGLSKRELWNEEMEKVFSNKEEADISQTYLFIVDIDFFKKINDTYGHPVGDDVLIIFSKVLNTFINKDISIYRIGGEEFSIIAKNCLLEDANKLGEDIRFAVEEYFQNDDIFQGKHINPNTISTLDKILKRKKGITSVTCTIGFSNFQNDDSSYKDALIRADRALYKGKELSRNVAIRYTEDLDTCYVKDTVLKGLLCKFNRKVLKK